MDSIGELLEITINLINIGRNTVVVTVPAKKRRGKYCYPFGRGTPKAEILSTNNDKDVVAFDAVDLLAFLIVASDCEVEESKPKTLDELWCSIPDEPGYNCETLM